MNSRFAVFLQACVDCLEACDAYVDPHVQEKNLQIMSVPSRSSQECADICSYTIEMITRRSAFDKSTILLCAEICGRCAAAYVAKGDPHDQLFVAICMRCQVACRELVA